MMKVLDRYLLTQVIHNFGFGVALFVTILTAGDFLFRITRLWLQSKIPFFTIIQVFLYSLPSFLIYVFPMSILLSVLLTVSRMVSDSEVIAMKASGISLKRFILPVLFFAIWICIGTVYLQEAILPTSAQNLQRIIGGDSVTSWLFQENTFFRDRTDKNNERIFYVKKIDREKSLLSGVIVQEYDSQGLRRILNADEAFLKNGKWIFLNGVMYEVGLSGNVERVVRFEKEEIKTEQSMEDVLKSQKNPQEMSFAELKNYITREHENQQQVYHLQLMLWQKTAIPFACIFFALIGVPLGIASPRSGKAVGIGMSILIVFGYYVLLSVCGTIAEGGGMSPFLGAWFGNIVTGISGLVLLFAKDSTFEVHYYHFFSQPCWKTIHKMREELFHLFFRKG
ncbi:MAG: LptF/LptG family permease [Candidatus Atribacteria bacterium]|nr:LptF/LptG family permease [Candidatus Atribacteria bacterium]